MDVYLNEMQVVKTGRSLRERAEYSLFGVHHRAVVVRLRRLREELETGVQPEPWSTLEVSAVSLLADVCDALLLTGDEKAGVLGRQGLAAYDGILDESITLQVRSLNTRQLQALDYVREQSQITNGDYQQLCPNVSAETLRLDLVDLVARGLLRRCGRCRGTYYVNGV